MKKVAFLLLGLLLIVSLVAAEAVISKKMFTKNSMSDHTPKYSRATATRTIILADFEDTWEELETAGWYKVDETVLSADPEHQWHLNGTTTAPYVYGTSGYSWYMGHEDGWYTDKTYIYLQSPPFTVNASEAYLKFKVNFSIEEPASHQAYDGWDGANVQIRKANPANAADSVWTVLTTSRTYNFTAGYGFAYNGGPIDQGGWGGSSNGWQDITCDLSAYTGDYNVRWVFASDPAYCSKPSCSCGSGGNDEWGIAVDNIQLSSTAVLDFDDYHPTSNAYEDWTQGVLTVYGGDLWHQRTYDNPPSGDYVMACQYLIEKNPPRYSYHANMENHLISQPYLLPSRGKLSVDFMIAGGVFGPGEDDNDGIGWTFSDNDGTSWKYISNPHGHTTVVNANTTPPTICCPNYYFSMGGELSGFDNFSSNWVPSTSQHLTTYGDLHHYRDGDTVYNGQTLRFRWTLQSDTAGQLGTGLVIDNLTITQTLEFDPPSQVACVVETVGTDDDVVITITWVAPENPDEIDFVGYKVYKRTGSTTAWTLISGETPITALTFTDPSAVKSAINHYGIEALYTDTYDGAGVADEVTLLGASERATASIYFTGDTETEIVYDDGTPTVVGTFANNVIYVNKFTPDTTEDYRVSCIAVYITERPTASWNLRIYKQNSTSHAFTTSLLASSVQVGWNYFTLHPSSQGIGFLAGSSIYVGFHRTSGGSIGIVAADDIEAPISYTSPGTPNTPAAFTEYAAGTFMIRLYVDTENVTVSDDDPVELLPSKLVASNYPNPFNPETTISFSLPVAGHASVQVYNIRGQLVNTLLNEEVKAGQTSVVWKGIDQHGRNVSSGIYFYKIKTERDEIISKMILMK